MSTYSWLFIDQTRNRQIDLALACAHEWVTSPCGIVSCIRCRVFKGSVTNDGTEYSFEPPYRVNMEVK